MTAPATAEVVIVGGGIAGCSLAYYLAAAGMRDVLVVEAETLGSGATAHSMGGVRQQFSTPLEVEVAKLGLEFWRNVADRFEASCPFSRDGYLLLTQREDLAERLRSAARLQRALQAGPVSVLTGRELLDVAPWLRVDDATVGCHTPDDGRINPTDGLAAIIAAARRLGVRFVEGWPVSAIAPGGKVSGPHELAAERVVVAAGVRTPALVAPLGVDLDIRAQHLQYATTGPALAGQPVPVTIDLDTGLFVEREGQGLVVSVLHEAAPPDLSAEQMLDDFAAAASARAPALLDVGIARTQAAAADLSADGHPYAGQAAEGLWVLAGFAGHGTMHGPVVAEALAAVMTGGTPAIDLAEMDPLRTPAAAEWLVGSRKG